MLFDTVFNDYYTNVNKPRKYVPYNLVKISNTEYALEFNVLGMSQDELDIEVQNNKLYVSGTPKVSDNRDYIVNHLSLKPFNLEFSLQEQIEVRSAKVNNGILTVALEMVIPEEKKPKKIAITH